MKLSERYKQAAFSASVFVLVITAVIYYFLIHYFLARRVDKDLVIEEEEIRNYVSTYHKMPLPGNFKGQKVEYFPVNPVNPIKRRFENTTFQDPEKSEPEPGRALLTSVAFDGNLMRVIITKSRAEMEAMFRLIFLVTVLVTILLVVGLMMINRFVLNKLWSPFFYLLNQVKIFNVKNGNDMDLLYTNIDEFAELNKAVATMARRVKSEYKELQSFTDNVSHEMMTPMAVINSKLDTLLQTDTFSKRQGELLEDIYNAVSRLSRLNQSLLLLAKIENNLIRGRESMDFKHLVEDKLSQFSELISDKNIKVTSELSEKHVEINKYLADILLNNLLGNAIRHNKVNGHIHVVLNEKKLLFANSGENQALNEEKTFERFYRGASSEGVGLGLAISKQICNSYGWGLHYSFHDMNHEFTVVF